MKPTDEMKNAGSRSLRWWMILACLVASWLCWWGVNRWLEPRPLWSSSLPEGRVYYPLSEDKDSQKLLVGEMQYSGGFSLKGMGLAILDRSDGQLLYQSKLNDSRLLVQAEPQYITRLMKDSVWRISTHFNQANGSTTIQLRHWKYQDQQDEQIVHTWSGWQRNVIWPEGSRVIIIRTPMPVELLCLGGVGYPFGLLSLELLHRRGVLEAPVLYESWELPETPEGPLRFLARWTIPASRCHQYPVISNKGKWAVFSEFLPGQLQAYQRIKASQQTRFTAKALFDIIRREPKVILIYDIASGELKYQLEQNELHFSVQGFSGDFFISQSIYPRDDATITMEEIDTVLNGVNQSIYSMNFIINKTHAFRLDIDGLHELKWPEGLPRQEVYLYFHGPQLTASRRMGNQLIYYELQCESDDQLTISRTAQFDRDQGFNWLGSFQSTKQYCLIKSPTCGRYFAPWEDKWPWLDSLLNFIKRHLTLDFEVVVAENDHGRQREHTFQQSPAGQPVNKFSQLFLLDTVKDGEATIKATLNCYELPLRLYSPWWCRGAACLPVVLLLVMFAIRWKRIPRS